METVVMEAVSISTTGSPCDELYSDIRADPFDALTGQFNGFSVNFPINHPTFSSNCCVENFDSAGADNFQFVNSGVIESVYLNTEIDKQGDMCLLSVHAIGRSPRSHTVKAAVGSVDDRTEKGSIDAKSHSIEQTNVSGLVYPVFTGIKENDLSDPSLSSLYNITRNVEVSEKGVEFCHKENNDHEGMLPSSVNVIAKESKSRTLQMFLDGALDSDFNKNNSCSNSPCLKTNKFAPDGATTKVTLDNEEGIANKYETNKTVFMDLEKKDSIFLESGLTGDHFEVKTCNSKPSHRSLRVQTCQKATSVFTCQVFSDNKDVTDNENEIPSTAGVKMKISKISKPQVALRDRTCRVKLYACNTCNAICKTKAELVHHKQTHNLSKLITCAQCGFMCKRKTEMRKHKKKHRIKSLYTCVECGYSGKRLKYLKKHMHTHSRELSFPCHLCDFRPRNKEALEKHLHEHSNMELYSHEECGDNFSEVSLLKNHICKLSDISVSTHALQGSVFKEDDQVKKQDSVLQQGVEEHQTVSSASTTTTVNLVTNVLEDNVPNSDDKGNNIQHTDTVDNKTAIRNTTVEDCNKHTSKENQVFSRTYRFMKMKGGPLQCTMCSYSCTSKNLLTRHMMRHSDNKPCICPQCGASFKRKDHLKVHKLTHDDLRPYKCPHCGYRTHRRHRLRLHVLTHQNNKPVKCSMCAFSCKREYDLRYHLRNKHDVEAEPEPTAESQKALGDIVLKCEICDYTCDSHKRLKYHMTRHENKTPHCCPHCEYKCSSRSSLADHLLQHAGIKPCVCSECGMAFRNTSRLNRHKLVHSDIKPYSCSFCDFSSRSKYNLKQHTLRHTDQQKTRRRNRNSTKLNNSNFTSNEIIDQGSKEAVNPSFNAEVQSLVDHMSTNIQLDNVQSHRDDNYLTQIAKNISGVIETCEAATIPQCVMRNQTNVTNDYYKERDKIMDQSTSNGFNTMYQGAHMTMNPYHVDRTSYQSVMNQTQAYSDPYQNLNPFFGHPPPIPYNANVNTGHTNQDFCYIDTTHGSGYGIANPYFYNETVFPGNVNSNMTFYMYQSSSNNSCALNPSPSTSTNQNLFHLNPPANHIAVSILQQQPEPQAVAPSVPVTQNQSQQISEVEDSCADNLSMDGEDVSEDVPEIHSNEAAKPSEPRSQAKKTGATLSGSRVLNNGLSESAIKSTHICSDCGYICLTNTMLQRHKTTHIDLKPHKCDDCGKSFKRVDHMKAHKRTHSQSKPHSCKHCSYTCSRKYRLKLHEMTHTNEHSFSCSVCESSFHSEHELEEHMRIHSDGFMFACNKCDFKCKDKVELKTHGDSHKNFLCVICNYVSRSAREFCSHKRMHGKKDELTCSLCSYTCDSQKRLKYHMERHGNKTPYECPHCDYKCSSRSSLTDHLLQHEGLKPFLCTVCGMKFRNVSRLNRHKMTHTDLKPHTCDYCSFCSRSKYNLKQHILRHFK